MLSKKLIKALNDQINAEYYSAYLYHSMSAYMEGKGLKGVAKWLFCQAKEEMAHGINIYQYTLDRGVVPTLSAINQPPSSFKSVTHIFDEVLKHEMKVTKSINEIATLAIKENDHATYHFIMWYVNEQVEEEANVNDILCKLNLIGDDKAMLLTFDNELATRTFVNPFPNNQKI